MGQLALMGSGFDDPRKLRDMLGKAAGMASDHALSSVVVGLSGREGDLLFPEIVDFVESALRMDDAIFRMTRERAVLMLADVDEDRAAEILERLLSGFRERFSTAVDPDVALAYFEVTPDTQDVSVKRILPILFAPRESGTPVAS
jgi:hypothetical protein